MDNGQWLLEGTMAKGIHVYVHVHVTLATMDNGQWTMDNGYWKVQW